MYNRKPIFGLTGNIGCGKSTVGKMLEKLHDAIIIDSDTLAKQIAMDPIHQPTITAMFGRSFDLTHEPERKALAQLVFNNPPLLETFQRFIHPLVRAAVIAKREQVPAGRLFIVENAILFESGSRPDYDAIIVAYCNITEQWLRLHLLRGMSDQDIESRMNLQWSTNKKIKHANFVIDTACSLVTLQKHVNHLVNELKQLL